MYMFHAVSSSFRHAYSFLSISRCCVGWMILVSVLFAKYHTLTDTRPFYHVMLCTAWTMLSKYVCPSVCLSVTWR